MTARMKRNMTFASLTLAGLLAAGAAIAGTRHADQTALGPGGPAMEGGMLHALASLDLTDDQKGRIKAILETSRPTIEPLVDALAQSKRALSDAVHAPAFDEQAIRAAASATAKSEGDLAVERARVGTKVRALLTPEQRDRLDARRQEFQQRMEDHMNGARSRWHDHSSDF